MKQGHSLRAYAKSFTHIVLILPFFTSCTFWRQAQGWNKKNYLDRRIAALEEKANKTPTLDYRTPYTILLEVPEDANFLIQIASDLEDRGTPTRRTDKILTKSKDPNKRPIIRLARLLGRGDILLKYTSSTEEVATQAEGFLLLGNYGEAKRIIEEEEVETPILPYLFLSQKDTTSAINSLNTHLSQKTWDAQIQRNLLRLLWHLSPENIDVNGSYSQLLPSEEERNYWQLVAQAHLKELESQDLESLVKRLLEGRYPPPWDRSIASLIVPHLLEHEMYVPLYDVLTMLNPQEAQRYPLSILVSMQKEVDLLRRYEQNRPISSVVKNTPTHTATSFSQRYGAVKRGRNWAMQYLNATINTNTTNIRPSESQYKRTRRLLNQILKPKH